MTASTARQTWLESGADLVLTEEAIMKPSFTGLVVKTFAKHALSLHSFQPLELSFLSPSRIAREGPGIGCHTATLAIGVRYI